MKSPSLIKRFLGSVAGLGAREPAAVDRRTRRALALCEALLSERGEASGAALARDALEAIKGLDGAPLASFFDMLAEKFSPDPNVIVRTAEVYRQEPSQANLVRLQGVVEPPRQELFRRLNMAPGGTAALVDMRRRLLMGLGAKPEWAGIEADLVHLLTSWFNRGFLVLERIDWRTSALVLEKLSTYEAVHEVRGWRDLRRRLQADRRCFAFFHPALPEEPIIFIEVALTQGMSQRVQPLLDTDSPLADPRHADCAIFYSITNCQEGLRGISFGNFLIKQVAEDLGREFPRLGIFATLSPLPGFRAWVTSIKKDLAETPGGNAVLDQLELMERPLWHEQAGLAAKLKKPLMRLGAWYLLHAKRAREPLDPVARFHLGNGASIEQLNWLADISKTGMARSAGMMVNYQYRLGHIERNHEAYVKQSEVVASARLRAISRECELAAKRKPAP
ncbi:MAG: malonyl-CoA decarboxylase [Betaproteobacteria bacterium]|nr:malonyl-CoA decarboxylase [Betaproteobacteria bacterium]